MKKNEADDSVSAVRQSLLENKRCKPFLGGGLGVCFIFLSGLLPSCIAMTLISLMACQPLERVTFWNSLRSMATLLCDLENAENEYVSNALKMLSHYFVISLIFFKSIFFLFSF